MPTRAESRTSYSPSVSPWSASSCAFSTRVEAACARISRSVATLLGVPTPTPIIILRPMSRSPFNRITARFAAMRRGIGDAADSVHLPFTDRKPFGAGWTKGGRNAWIDRPGRPAAGPCSGSGAGDERQGIPGQGPCAAGKGDAGDGLAGFSALARRDRGLRAGVPGGDRCRPKGRQTSPLLSAAQGSGTDRFCDIGGELRKHARRETRHEREIRFPYLHGRALSLRRTRKAYSVRPSKSSKIAKVVSATNAKVISAIVRHNADSLPNE